MSNMATYHRERPRARPCNQGLSMPWRLSQDHQLGAGSWNQLCSPLYMTPDDGDTTWSRNKVSSNKFPDFKPVVFLALFCSCALVHHALFCRVSSGYCVSARLSQSHVMKSCMSAVMSSCGVEGRQKQQVLYRCCAASLLTHLCSRPVSSVFCAIYMMLPNPLQHIGELAGALFALC